MMDLNLLHPIFKQKVLNIQSRMKELKFNVVPYSGLRTPAEQAAIYSVGRATPETTYHIQGLTIITPSKKQYPNWAIVSKAEPFLSPHQWGLAVDFGWVLNGKFSFDPLAQGDWKALYKAAQLENCRDITTVVAWDKGHIEDAILWKKVWDNMNKLKPIYLAHGLEAVWLELSKIK